MKVDRRIYLIFVNYAPDKDPPVELDLTKRYLHPLGEAGFTVDPRMVNYRAEDYARHVWASMHDPDPYQGLDFAAYMVTGPSTAALVWWKRAGRVRGRWASWHGNPSHKRIKGKWIKSEVNEGSDA